MKTNWNLNLILSKEEFVNIDSYRKKVETATNMFVAKWSKNNQYLTNVKALKTALDEYENWNTHFGSYYRESYYFWLKQSLDLNDPKVKAANNNVHQRAVNLYNKIQFFEINLSKIDKKFQKVFLKSKDLLEYHHYLEKLFKIGKYVLSEKEEKILNLKGKVSHSNWVNMVQGLISKEEREVLNKKGIKVKKNFSEILELINDKNKKVRNTSAIALNDIFKKNLDIAENELNSVFEDKKIDDLIRGYKKPDESRHVSDDVESETVETLLNAVTQRFDIPKRFYKLKAKLFKVKKLQYHERNLEFGKDKKSYEYKEAYNLVYKMLSTLDPKFATLFKSYHENGQVDVLPKKGKRSGAFCSYGQKTAPIFILQNFTGSRDNIQTLAHEFGHALQFELSKIQNSLNFDFPMATAETASTFFEDFILEEIIKEANDEEKLSIMLSKLNDDISTIFRQTACYNLELDLHKTFRENGYLSSKEIGTIFLKHMSSYMGDAVELSEGSENWWVYWSHIRSFFYVYSYAFGLLVSKAMQREVKNSPKHIEKVKTFLSAGSSKSPYEVLKDINIDISKLSTWEKGIDEIEDLLNRTEALAKKLKKI